MSFTIGARGVRTALAALAMSAAIAVPQAEAGITFQVDERVDGNLFASTGKTIVSFNGDSRNFYAGGFDLSADGGPLGDFIAFCLDIATAFSVPSSYALTDTPFAGAILTDTQIGLIQSLYDAVYDTLSLDTDWGGFQSALWEIVEETSGTLDATNAPSTRGSFYLDNGSSTATKANEFLALAQAYDGRQKYRLIFLESQDISDPVGRDSQNLVTVAAIPLPAAGILMLAALAGGAAAYRRRKAA